MKALLIPTVLALTITSAYAAGKHPEPPKPQYFNLDQQFKVSSGSASSSGAKSVSDSTSSASSGVGDISNSEGILIPISSQPQYKQLLSPLVIALKVIA